MAPWGWERLEAILEPVEAAAAAAKPLRALQPGLGASGESRGRPLELDPRLWMILVLVLQDLHILLLSHILGLYLDPCFLSICWLARALML